MYERGTEAQAALVLLNKGDTAARFEIGGAAGAGAWRDATGGNAAVAVRGEPLALEVPAHGVRVLLQDGRIRDPGLRRQLDRAMEVLAESSAR